SRDVVAAGVLLGLRRSRYRCIPAARQGARWNFRSERGGRRPRPSPLFRRVGARLDMGGCLPAFIGLESDRQFGSQPYHGDTGPIPITRYPTDGFDAEFNDAYMAMGHCAIEDHNKPDCLGFAPWPTNRVGDDRASTLLQLLPPLRTRSNVTILPRTQVRRVLIDGQTAVGVLVDTPNGPEVLESDSIVLAGGTFGSPEILFASGVGDADDLRAAEIDV